MPRLLLPDDSPQTASLLEPGRSVLPPPCYDSPACRSFNATAQTSPDVSFPVAHNRNNSKPQHYDIYGSQFLPRPSLDSSRFAYLVQLDQLGRDADDVGK
jgi:hypothetical protein